MYTSTELFKAEAAYRREHLRDIYRPTSSADRAARAPWRRFRRRFGRQGRPIARVARPVSC